MIEILIIFVYFAGYKCGQPNTNHGVENLNLISRIVGGQESKYGDHCWQVSLQRDGHHICGGSIITRKWILTAAHCFPKDLNKILKSLRVSIGDHDLSIKEKWEQKLSVKQVICHTKFDPFNPFSYDIAMLELEKEINFNDKVRPICLPNANDNFAPGTLCTVTGWGRLKENGPLPTKLHEVQLAKLEDKRCGSVLSTLRKSKGHTVFCAGFEEGGKDACQGDSGGPIVCPRETGALVLAGITSWGMGCAREWANNAAKPKIKQGSPGVFTDLKLFLTWIYEILNQGTENQRKSASKLCSSVDGGLTGTAGHIDYPGAPQQHYGNNEMCVWSINVPDGKHILLEFSKFDLEAEATCSADSLMILTSNNILIGQFCGRNNPLPMLIESNKVFLKFTSDFSESRTGFSLTFKAVAPHSQADSGCGSVAVLLTEGTIQTLHYPRLYESRSHCHWIIQAPKDHIIKLSFEDFELEPSDDCTYDSLKVYGDAVESQELAALCGLEIPPPVVSVQNLMVLYFKSDVTYAYRGFRANFSFHAVEPNLDYGKLDQSDALISHTTEHPFPVDLCGIPSAPVRLAYHRIAGGEEAIPTFWPWQVSLRVVHEHLCGGAIIGPKWIITAAHCVYNRKDYVKLMAVVAGDHDILNEDASEQKRSVKKVIIHPRYNDSTLDYDLALLLLEDALQYNKNVRPVCLPHANWTLEPGKICTVTGWGSATTDGKMNEKLQQLNVPILSPESCATYYPEVTDRMFCAGFTLQEGKDTCTGDSGGPLVCQSQEKRYFLCGITSWGAGCGNSPKPGVYTFVLHFTEWIHKQMTSHCDRDDTGILLQSTSTQLPSWRTENKLKRNLLKDKALQHVDNSRYQNDSQTMQLTNECKDVVIKQEKGQIQSPSYPNPYPNNINCQWRIIAPKNMFIKVKFREISISAHGGNCSDFFALYDGTWKNKKMKAKFCGDANPCTLWSRGEEMTMEFKADHQGSAAGVSLEYSIHASMEEQP
ncbi:ovochymase-2 isoform X1 [Erpetoichthys calabaricus]|uniref:ovochymase-2 isoform X1 n=1 Tax=Erpetoichthys calabaricus TaxID=27687 RepID=UPI0022340428|nr:ovochymase-2 isoform X1 [Erpetoichthys calabaricus]